MKHSLSLFRFRCPPPPSLPASCLVLQKSKIKVVCIPVQMWMFVWALSSLWLSTKVSNWDWARGRRRMRPVFFVTANLFRLMPHQTFSKRDKKLWQFSRQKRMSRTRYVSPRRRRCCCQLQRGRVGAGVGGGWGGRGERQPQRQRSFVSSRSP